MSTPPRTHHGAEAPSEPVPRTRVAEHVRAHLAERILSLELPPGTPLTEQALAGAYDVSRNTVREALRLLEADGLVRHHRHRGAAVAEPTAGDVDDLFAARRAVELAGARAAEAVDVGVLADLDESVAAMQRAAESGDRRGAVDADLAFHRTLAGLAGSTRLDRFYESVQSELRLALVALDRARPDPDKADEHRRLRRLAAARDASRLAAALESHLADAAAHVHAVSAGTATGAE